LIAPSCNDESTVEDLDFWQAKCEAPAANLLQEFSTTMQNLDPKPAILAEIMNTYKSKGTNKQMQFCVAAIDWMVQHSTWALKGKSQLRVWRNDVVKQWFDTENTESANSFLERAEHFLHEGAADTNWGAKILGRVIETNSYVVFFRMGPLASLLFRGYCELQESQDAHQPMQENSSEPATSEKKCCALPIPISLIVSSSNWNISFGESNGHNSADILDIVSRLRRIACLPPKLLQENEYSMSDVDSVKCGTLYNLEKTDKKDPDGGNTSAASSDAHS